MVVLLLLLLVTVYLHDIDIRPKPDPDCTVSCPWSVGAMTKTCRMRPRCSKAGRKIESLGGMAQGFRV